MTFWIGGDGLARPPGVCLLLGGGSLDLTEGQRNKLPVFQIHDLKLTACFPWALVFCICKKKSHNNFCLLDFLGDFNQITGYNRFENTDKIIEMQPNIDMIATITTDLVIY